MEGQLQDRDDGWGRRGKHVNLCLSCTLAYSNPLYTNFHSQTFAASLARHECESAVSIFGLDTELINLNEQHGIARVAGGSSARSEEARHKELQQIAAYRDLVDLVNTKVRPV